MDRRSDIYSLGVILFELTTGRRLYKGSTEYQLIEEVVEADIEPPTSFMEYPNELEAIVLKCLEKNPYSRYATAREVQADLENFSREYQIMFSALVFSSFLEPLLEKARCPGHKW
ncbi:MAG: protein kinase [Myxococcales bacterium]|nr:protein kinase [Myxococcales bacterium]